MTRALSITVSPTSRRGRRSCAAVPASVFAALAQNPALIQPMRAVYADLHRRIAQDGLPPGVGETVAAAIDGLWLDWVLGIVPLEQVRVWFGCVARSRICSPVRPGSPLAQGQGFIGEAFGGRAV